MIRAGICGFGGLGHVHADSLWKIDGVEVKAVCDSNPAQLAAKEVKFNIDTGPAAFDISSSNTYTDFDEMIKNENLDMVVIALPTDLHADLSIRAMDAGCHVLCEKPMALTVEECDRMIEARDRNGRQLMVGQCIRFWPEYRYLHQAIKDRRYGRLLSLTMERSGACLPTSWFNDCNRSGGAIVDLHVHDVDWAQMALGRPDNLCARGIFGKSGGVDDLTAIWQYASGPLVTIRCSWIQASGFVMAYKAFFENATLDFSSANDPVLRVFEPSADTFGVIECEDVSGYEEEMRYFVECVRGEHENVVCTAESSRDSIDLALAEAKAISEGRL